MNQLSRRDALQLMAGIPLLAAGLSPKTITRAVESARAAQAAATAGQAFTPVFFTAHELDTVNLLVNYIIPRDDRSGSATDAAVPEFMDFILNDQKGMQTPTRGGLAWLDTECRERFGQTFVLASDRDRRQLLDLIAYPAKAPKELSQGVSFFNDFRDLTASGFFSSKMGVEDLQYLGNVFVHEWEGCPPAALAKLGVKYDQG